MDAVQKVATGQADAYAKTNAGKLLASQIKVSEAMEKFGNPNLPIDPSIAALLNNYGVTLFKQEKKEQAIAAFRRALAINPNLKDARESLAVATGEKPMPEKPDGPAPTPAAGVAPQIPMKLPQSPTLGPLP